MILGSGKPSFLCGEAKFLLLPSRQRSAGPRSGEDPPAPSQAFPGLAEPSAGAGAAPPRSAAAAAPGQEVLRLVEEAL